MKGEQFFKQKVDAKVNTSLGLITFRGVLIYFDGEKGLIKLADA
jgi:hypothetical protein